ncbi:hypothetical protein N7516_006757 [Penicillium verrucosum]|uniref:uncharacterized protein n=1 Tax=Penicillium verrucosum TaxID=60171 RepID=UPI0025452390|nr:uncharacterized protein N7516_006757 [Penicillium verrucosum]KAJ5932268.1 hypothetical protein N7516_006757 [Penicillium verrucosum]
MELQMFAARKRRFATSTSDVRQMFGSFSTELDEDCDYVEAIAEKRATINSIAAGLDSPDMQRALRLNEEMIDHRLEYDNMLSIISDRPAHKGRNGISGLWEELYERSPRTTWQTSLQTQTQRMRRTSMRQQHFPPMFINRTISTFP